jgi:tRNA A-37 threonylcarbamoyl transferase component Bud32
MAPTLDRGPSRAVLVEDGRAIKVWRHASGWQRLRDGARARRERDVLAALSARGVRVPRPLALRQGSRGHELAMELVPHAVNVQRALEGAEPWPRGRARAFAELGRLLAALHGAGLEHGDLHPGNALLDADGRAWAVDFDKARLARAPRPARFERELVELCAYARERTSPRERARFALAWHRALPAALRARVGADRAAVRALCVRVEGHAPARRDEQVRRLLKRWLRESSRTRRVAIEHGACLVARACEPVDLALAPAELARARGWRLEELATREGARRRWLELAENVERARAGPRPAVLWWTTTPRVASTER